MRPTTLFLFVDAFVARAEVRWRGRQPEVVACRRQERGAGGVADRLDALLAEEPCRGTAVVFSDDVFLQTLELPQRAIAGLSAHDLRQALALEAQAQSGLGGDVATTCHRPRDDRAFLVAQCSRGDLAACAENLERSGGRLLAVRHPAALPLPLAEVANGRWVRHEEWGGLRAIVRGRGQHGERARVGGFAAADTGDEPSERLVLRRSGPGEGAFDLGTDEALRLWFARWAEALARDADPLLLAPPEAAAVRHRRWLIAGALLLAAAVAALLDRSHLQQEVLAAQQQLVRTRAPLDRLQALQADLAAVQRQLAVAPEAAPVLPPATSPWTGHTVGALLEHLAQQRPAGVLLDELELGWRRSEVRGFAPSPRDADVFAEALARAVQPLGFLVQPTRRDRTVLGAVDGCTFVLELSPMPAVAAAPSPTPVVEVGR
jgi:hypothetical protein